MIEIVSNTLDLMLTLCFKIMIFMFLYHIVVPNSLQVKIKKIIK